MIVMPANSSGWFWHCLARETGRLGHLYSPGHQRGPWPWFPFGMDNLCYPLWNPEDNSFDEERWQGSTEAAWHRLLFWAECNKQRPLWLIVPDRPGSRDETLVKWERYSPALVERKLCPLALAVQNGMTPGDVRALAIQPAVIAVGGTTEWKWETVEMWTKEFPRVHVLRCNAPDKLAWMQQLGIESTDGTGWNRGDRKQTEGIERFCRGLMNRTAHPLWPYACRGERKASRQHPGQPVQEVFA